MSFGTFETITKLLIKNYKTNGTLQRLKMFLSRPLKHIISSSAIGLMIFKLYFNFWLLKIVINDYIILLTFSVIGV